MQEDHILTLPEQVVDIVLEFHHQYQYEVKTMRCLEP